MIAQFYYFLFLALGLVVSYEDWSERRIRNRWIALGMLAGVAGLGYLFWNSVLGYQHLRWGRLGEYYLPWRYYPRVLVHLGLSFAAAWTMWHLDVWPAGDAKLYTLFAFLVVLIDPNVPGFPMLLFMLLLINIFVPAGLFFAAETVLRLILRSSELLRVDWETWRKARIEESRIRLRDAWPYRYQYLTLVLNLYAMFYLMGTAQKYTYRLALGPFGKILIFLMMFVAWGRISRVLRDRRLGYLALAVIAAAMTGGYVFGHWDILAIVVTALKMTFTFGMFLSVARTAFHWYIERESRQELHPGDLRPGVLLSDETWAKLSRESGLADKLGARYSDGLSSDDVEAVKTWLAAQPAPAPAPLGAGPDSAAAAPSGPATLADCTFYQTIPFAAWIFLGSAFTVMRRVNLVAILVPYFDRAWEMSRAGAARWLF